MRTSLLFVVPPAPNLNSEMCFKAVRLNSRREALKTVLNLSLSPVSFNQSTQQVESFLRKVEELQAALTIPATAD